MTIIAGILAAGYPVMLFLFVRHLQTITASVAQERQSLLQRIQAPEVAVTQHQVDMAGPDLPAVSLEDDADYWRAQQDALERMEQLEREFEARVA